MAKANEVVLFKKFYLLKEYNSFFMKKEEVKRRNSLLKKIHALFIKNKHTIFYKSFDVSSLQAALSNPLGNTTSQFLENVFFTTHATNKNNLSDDVGLQNDILLMKNLIAAYSKQKLKKEKIFQKSLKEAINTTLIKYIAKQSKTHSKRDALYIVALRELEEEIKTTVNWDFKAYLSEKK